MFFVFTAFVSFYYVFGMFGVFLLPLDWAWISDFDLSLYMHFFSLLFWLKDWLFRIKMQNVFFIKIEDPAILLFMHLGFFWYRSILSKRTLIIELHVPSTEQKRKCRKKTKKNRKKPKKKKKKKVARANWEVGLIALDTQAPRTRAYVRAN